MSKRTTKHLLIFVVKLSITSLLLFLVLRRVNWSELSAIFSEIQLTWLIVAVLVGFGRSCVICLRWKVLLQSQGIQYSYVRALCTYLVSGFFDSVFPANICGDVYRIQDSGAQGLTRSTVAVVWDRMLGFASQLALAMVGLTFFYNAPAFRSLAPMLFIILLVFLFAVLVVVAVISCLTGRAAQGPLLTRGPRWITSALTSLSQIPRISIRAFAAGLSLSFCAQLLMVLGNYFLLCTLGLEQQIAFLYLVLVVCVVVICNYIPISINGIGVNENLFFLFFSPSGVSVEQVVAYSWLLLFISRVPFALAGAILYGLRAWNAASALGEQRPARPAVSPQTEQVPGD